MIEKIFFWSCIPFCLQSINLMKQKLRNAIRWCPTSIQDLEEADEKILSYLKCEHRSYFVDIGNFSDLKNTLIWTVELTSDRRNSIQSIQQEAKPDILNHEKPKNEQGLPLVMIHGFAAGVGLWVLNFDELAARSNRKIFAFDLLGFAKSSRPNFPLPSKKGLTKKQQIKAEAKITEESFIESIEKWRQKIGEPLRDGFIILGHSFGAYLALGYALKYPQHVAHVILADPWGIPSEHQNFSSSNHMNSRQLPWWAQLIGKLFLNLFNPLSALRAIGPWGPKFLNSVRSDIKKKFERLKNDGQPLKRLNAAEVADHPPPLDSADELSGDEIDGSESENSRSNRITKMIEEEQCDVLNYIYHCNAQSKPSGETAFTRLCSSTGWAILPMIERVHELHRDIRLTFLYGSRSWIDRQTGLQAKYILATKVPQASTNLIPSINYDDSDDYEIDERVDVHVIDGAGHHVYADKPEKFNELVITVCENADSYRSSRVVAEENDIEQNDSIDFASVHHQQQQRTQPSSIQFR
ncbi:Protein ABHD4 [Sarcoptes scabiei]|nr:Protein ABHD4 [Sarcoptes scabiei]